jgi:hypothetical protein
MNQSNGRPQPNDHIKNHPNSLKGWGLGQSIGCFGRGGEALRTFARMYPVQIWEAQ